MKIYKSIEGFFSQLNIKNVLEKMDRFGMGNIFLGQGDVRRVVIILFWGLYNFDWENDRVDDIVVMRWGYRIDVVVYCIDEVDDVLVIYLIVNFYFEDKFVVGFVDEVEVMNDFLYCYNLGILNYLSFFGNLCC